MRNLKYILIMLEIIKLLKNTKGYKEYKQPEKEHYILNTLLQKRVESKSVCETNDKLCIDIKATKIQIGNQSHEGFEVLIIAEKKQKWWNLSCYSLTKDEILNQIDEIEKTLILLFNCL